MVRGVDTKAFVFDLVRSSGRASRAGLVEKTGLTGATISTIVRQLLDEGLVEENGRARSTGGKPRTFVQVVPDARYAVGVHLTRSDMVLVLVNLVGLVIGRTRRPFHVTRDQSWRLTIAEAVEEILCGCGVPRERVLGVGVVASERIRADIEATAESETVNIVDDDGLQRAYVSYWADGLPVVIDNDASAAALGEWWVSPADTTDDALVVYLGAGIGSGYLSGGNLHRGAHRGEGELGHVCVDLDGPQCVCGARGCLEAVAGPAAVVRRAASDMRIAPHVGLGDGYSGRGSVEADFAAVTRAAHAGVVEAQKLLEDSARAVAVAVRSVVNVLDVATVVLTGPSAGVAGAFYLPAVEAELALCFAVGHREVCEARLSLRSGIAAAMGAASTVLETAVRPLA